MTTPAGATGSRSALVRFQSWSEVPLSMESRVGVHGGAKHEHVVSRWGPVDQRVDLLTLLIAVVQAATSKLNGSSKRRSRSGRGVSMISPPPT
jgi:hypothetical protein